MENKDALPEPFDRQKNADVQPIPRSQKRGITSSELDWRERFEVFHYHFRNNSGYENVIDWIANEIAEVEKLAEERGRKGVDILDLASVSRKKIEEARSSLKAELIEAGEKMKLTEEGLEPFDLHSVATKSRNRAISDYQEIIKSA